MKGMHTFGIDDPRVQQLLNYTPPIRRAARQVDFQKPVDVRNKGLDATTFGFADPAEVRFTQSKSFLVKLGDFSIQHKVVVGGKPMYEVQGQCDGERDTLTKDEILDIIDPDRRGTAHYKRPGVRSGPFVFGKPLSEWLTQEVFGQLMTLMSSSDRYEEEEAAAVGKKRKRQSSSNSSGYATSSVILRCMSVHLPALATTPAASLDAPAVREEQPYYVRYEMHILPFKKRIVAEIYHLVQ